MAAVSIHELVDWYGTPLGMLEFVAVAKAVLGDEDYELLLWWACRSEPHLTLAELDRVERLAIVVGALMERWEPVGESVAARSVADRVERERD